MSKFKRLQGLHIKDDATARFSLDLIEGNPKLIVRSAGESNKPFFNAILKQSKTDARALQTGGDISTEKIDAVRKQDIALFVEFIVVGWEDVYDDDGNIVEFSAENCEEFLLAIPSDMFHQLRMFCLNSENFRNRKVMSQEELKALMGN